MAKAGIMNVQVLS